MDWEILEITKKNAIKEQVNQLNSTISYFQNKLIAELHPVLLHNKVLQKSENWWFVSDEGLRCYNSEDNLCFVNRVDTANYTSFKENNVAFTRMPTKHIDVLPEENLFIHFEAEFLDELKAKIAIVEYSGHKKIATTMVNVNEEAQITLNKSTKYIRVALKMTGRGMAIFKKMTLNRVFNATKPLVKKETKAPVSQPVKTFQDLKVACIFDEFTMTSYKEEVELITFSPDNWKETLEQNPPHFLFVESAWHGNFGTWQYKVGRYSNVDRNELFELLNWCKERNIPTVFWNKEDPIHFEKFIDSAKRFDYIYTTDANKIPDYQKHAKHKQVYALPFAAEPKHHNPIQFEERADGICFAGSYYANRHPERRAVMDQMLEISNQFGLTIYDRNFKRSEPEFRFPKQFEKSVVGSLSYSEIDKAYKGYRFILNVNSVIDSPTMFSRRVFEGMASGTPILSSYSKGINEIFGNLVMIAEKPEDLYEQMKQVSEDEDKYRKLSIAGIREIYEKHTYQHRLHFMLKNMGKNIPLIENEVTVIGIVQSEEEIKTYIKQFEQQTYQSKKMSLFVKDTESFADFNKTINTYQNENISIYLLDYMMNYQHLSDFITSDFVAFFGTEHFYGRNYLKDLMLATIYTDADFIGKNYYFKASGDKLVDSSEGSEYQFTANLNSSSSVLRTHYPFKKELTAFIHEFTAGIELSNYMKQGAKMFSSDKYNFIQNGKDAKETWIRGIEI